MQLHEQYRPASWADVIGQPKALARIERLRKRGLGGRAFWIAGQSGTGKTTIAKLLADELADDCCVEEYVGRSLGSARIDEIDRGLHVHGIGKGGRAVIVNESHGLSKPAIDGCWTRSKTCRAFRLGNHPRTYREQIGETAAR